MKELTKKIIESGIVDKTMAAMLERWGMLDVEDPSGEVPHRENIMKETLTTFIDELELLLQPEAIERQEVQLEPLNKEVYTGEDPD